MLLCALLIAISAQFQEPQTQTVATPNVSRSPSSSIEDDIVLDEVGLRGLYERFEQNGNGERTRVEIIAGMRRDETLRQQLWGILGIGRGDYSDEVFEGVYQSLDIKDDGNVSLDEFIEYARRSRMTYQNRSGESASAGYEMHPESLSKGFNGSSAINALQEERREQASAAPLAAAPAPWEEKLPAKPSLGSSVSQLMGEARSINVEFSSHEGDALAVIEALARPNLRLMFDVYHVQIMEGDLTRRLSALLPVIGHVQIAGVPDRGEPDAGEVDFRHLLAHLRSLRLCLRLRLPNPPPHFFCLLEVGSVSSAAAKVVVFARPSKYLTVFTRSSRVASSSQTTMLFGCIWIAETVNMWLTPSSMHLARA